MILLQGLAEWKIPLYGNATYILIHYLLQLCSTTNFWCSEALARARIAKRKWISLTTCSYLRNGGEKAIEPIPLPSSKDAQEVKYANTSLKAVILQ